MVRQQAGVGDVERRGGWTTFAERRVAQNPAESHDFGAGGIRDFRLLRRGIEHVTAAGATAGPVVVHSNIEGARDRPGRTLDDGPRVPVAPSHRQAPGRGPIGQLHGPGGPAQCGGELYPIDTCGAEVHGFGKKPPVRSADKTRRRVRPVTGQQPETEGQDDEKSRGGDQPTPWADHSTSIDQSSASPQGDSDPDSHQCC